MKRSLLAVLVISVIASVILSAIAISTNDEYTWEKTFEITKPEIECKIEIGDNRIIGCPVRIWVYLRLNGDCWWRREMENELELDDKCDGEWKDEWREWRDEWQECRDEWQEWKYRVECDRQLPIPIRECYCHINGTYSAHLYWWNQTSEDWNHVVHLQEDANITLFCGRFVQMYTFTPDMEGEYKVVVNFTLDSEIYTFDSED